jgi:branched-chain amino acid transport system substrate-binding protein
MVRSPVPRGLLASLLFGLLVASPLHAQTDAPDRLLIGHPACMSGRYAKAGEQAIGGIKACVAWVNDVHGGVTIGGGKAALEYKYYDCESKKEAVTSLIERLITVDKVDVVFSSYSSGLTLAGAPVAERYGMVFMDHGGASRVSSTSCRPLVPAAATTWAPWT